MMPPNPKDDKANDWFNALVAKLQYGQDYSVYPGSSKLEYNDAGEQTGISVILPNIKLHPTAITKLYELIVEGVEMPDVEYTEEEDKQFYDDLMAKHPELKGDE